MSEQLPQHQSVEAANEAGKKYLVEQGSHERPDITLHDYKQGFIDGVVYQEGLHLDKSADELLTERAKILKDMGTLASLQSESMGWVVEKTKKIKELEEQVKELQLAVDIRDAMISTAGLHHAKLDKDQKKIAQDITKLKTPKHQPTHTSVDDLIKELENSPYIGHKDGYFAQGFKECISRLKELLTGKIITTPEAIEKVWNASQNYFMSGDIDRVENHPDKATYLKQEFGIELKQND